MKGLLRETEHRLNQEKRNAQGGRIKNPLQLRSRLDTIVIECTRCSLRLTKLCLCSCNSHPDILHGNYTDSLLGQVISFLLHILILWFELTFLLQEMSVSCCMDTPTPSEQSDDTVND